MDVVELDLEQDDSPTIVQPFRMPVSDEAETMTRWALKALVEAEAAQE
jgi:hypothetical protein